MKSSSNIRPTAFYDKLDVWMPPEFAVETACPPVETRKEQVLAIFRSEKKDNTEKREIGTSPILHPAAISQGYATWQPGDVVSRPAEIRKTEWTFIDPSHVSYISIVEPKEIEFEEVVEQPPQVKPDLEKEISAILEQARIQAEELILAAQAEADNVLLQAQEEIDEQKKVGFQQGWDNACSEIEGTLKATHSMVGDVRAWKEDLMSQGEHILVDMLKEIAQKMFGEGVELDSNALQINLSRIMDSAHGIGNLNIFLNPRDAKNLDSSWSEYQTLISGGQVKIVPSGKITRGGCFLQGDMGIVDGRVETQLDAILKSFDSSAEPAE